MLVLGLMITSVAPATMAITGAPSPFPTAGTWLQTAKIGPDDADEPGAWGPALAGIYFGSTVAIDGGTLAVGTQWDRDADSSPPGSDEGYDWAYIFHQGPNGDWIQSAKLLPDHERGGDTFAYSLSVDEQAGIVVAGNPAAQQIHVFEEDSQGAWAEVTVIERDEGWGFGRRVDISEGVIVASAGGDSPVFLFEKRDGRWTETHQVPGGTQVALEGETLVASEWDPETNVKWFNVFEHRADSWKKTAVLDPAQRYDGPSTLPGHVDLAPGGDAIILGAPIDRRVYGMETEDAGLGVVAHGAAWIYEKTESGWAQTADLPNPDPSMGHELFGISVAMGNGTAVVGARGDLQNGGNHAGAAYVFERIDEEWVLTSKLRNHDQFTVREGDWFGSSVAMSEGTVAVGAPFDDNRRDGSPWMLSDDGDVPPCVHRDVPWECDQGEDAGSVYLYKAIGDGYTR